MPDKARNTKKVPARVFLAQPPFTDGQDHNGGDQGRAENGGGLKKEKSWKKQSSEEKPARWKKFGEEKTLGRRGSAVVPQRPFDGLVSVQDPSSPRSECRLGLPILADPARQTKKPRRKVRGRSARPACGVGRILAWARIRSGRSG